MLIIHVGAELGCMGLRWDCDGLVMGCAGLCWLHLLGRTAAANGCHAALALPHLCARGGPFNPNALCLPINPTRPAHSMGNPGALPA
jgi:hypothetical protein